MKTYVIERHETWIPTFLHSLIGFLFLFQIQVAEYFKKVEVGSGQRALEQTLETIKLNIHWVKENAETIDQWLLGYLNTKSS